MASKRSRKQNKKVRRERGHWLTDTSPKLAPGHYLPVNPRLTDITCPDCGANWSAPDSQRKTSPGGMLDHAPTCPIAKGYADAADDDRAWFIDHPTETERVRPPSMAEVQAVMLATGQALPDMPNGGQLAPGGHVVVSKISDELRRRDFSHTMLLASPALSPADGYHPDEFDETGKLWFREHFAPGEFGGQS